MDAECFLSQNLLISKCRPELHQETIFLSRFIKARSAQEIESKRSKICLQPPCQLQQFKLQRLRLHFQLAFGASDVEVTLFWCTFIYNYILNQQKRMSNQKTPFPPHMYPFMYPYPPPPFLNPFPSAEQKNPQYGMPNDFMPQPSYPMPPFGYPPYPMMYPPPPPAFYQLPQAKVHQWVPNQPKGYRQSALLKSGLKKKSNEKTEKGQKAQIQVIVLSDNESKEGSDRRGRISIKDDGRKDKLPQKDIILDQKLRKPIKRVQHPLKVERLPAKPATRERKKQIKHHQFKRYLRTDDDKDQMNLHPLAPETHYESFSRSSRTKFLTAKDGRGKIMIGEDYQADMPEFLAKNQSFSCWVDSRKNSLLSRTFI